MKPSMLGLLIAAGAFGASTIYLAVQLDEERTRADEVAELSRKLHGRIAELERMQLDLESLRAAGGGPAIVGGPSKPGNPEPEASPTSGAPAVEVRQVAVTSGDGVGRGNGPPERSEAMQRMMRTQMRANFKRVYADLDDKLGLTREDANKLIDLMVDQQMATTERARQDSTANLTPEQRSAAVTAQNEKNLAEISALIGAGKVDEYKAFQETVPARHEVEQLSRQLEANDATLTKDQRDRMVTALSEERKRVPQPKYSESVSREEYMKAMTAWQDDYNQRSATRAGSILTSDQQETYDEFQQLNKDMRRQFEARRAARESREGGSSGATPRQ